MAWAISNDGKVFYWVFGVPLTPENLISIFGVVVTGIGILVVGIMSSRYIDKQKDRAILRVFFEDGWDADRTDTPKSTQTAINIKVTCQNFGKTPAFRIRFKGYRETETGDPAEPTSLLMEGNKEVFPIITPLINSEDTLKKKIASRNNGIRFSGILFYEDIFGDKWRLKFSWDIRWFDSITRAHIREYKEQKHRWFGGYW